MATPIIFPVFPYLIPIVGASFLDPLPTLAPPGIILSDSVAALLCCVTSHRRALPLYLWLKQTGIDLTTFAPEGFQLSGAMFDPVWRAYLTGNALMNPIIALFAIAFFAALWPAMKAALIKPVEALTST